MSDSASLLLVEADILVRHPLASYLRECGFKVLEAASAAEARVLLEAGKPVDIMLADAAHDADAVFALAQWVRRNGLAGDVILAGSPVKAAAQAGEICEDGPALVKPYDHQLLLATIRRRLAARSS